MTAVRDAPSAAIEPLHRFLHLCYLGLAFFWACSMLTFRSSILLTGAADTPQYNTLIVVVSFLANMTVLLGVSALVERAPENLAKLMEGENTLELTIKGSRTEIEGMLNAIPEIAEKNFTGNENGLVQVSLKTEGNEDVREKLFYACAENQCPILRMENTHVSLEDIFLELTSQDPSEAKNTGASSDADAIQSLMEDTETPEEENKEGGQE